MYYLFKPLICFHIYGSFCCKNLYQSFNNNYFSKELFTFNTNTLFDANTVFLWGNLNQQLSSLINSQVIYSPINTVFIHMQGCCEINNNDIAINLSYNLCLLNKHDAKKIIKDIRECFKKSKT